MCMCLIKILLAIVRRAPGKKKKEKATVPGPHLEWKTAQSRVPGSSPLWAAWLLLLL